MTDTTAKVKKPKNYLNNKDILAEVVLSKAQGKMTEKFAHMMLTLANRYVMKPNFAGYTYRDDMVAYSLMQLVRSWASFDETRFTNAFAFYTQCIKNSFIQYLKNERKHRDIRDKLLVEIGMDPSWNYSEDDDNDLVEGGVVMSDEQLGRDNQPLFAETESLEPVVSEYVEDKEPELPQSDSTDEDVQSSSD